MNEDIHERSRILLGQEGLDRLKRAHVAVFGLGGVGGHATEALARCGVGRLTLVDADVVSPSNLNRQMFATADTVGMRKTEAAGMRIRAVAPGAELELRDVFFDTETKGSFDFSEYDYVVDAIDSVPSKVELILAARAADTPIISSMGAGNKLDPSRFRVADIYETSVCPLAKVMRKLLRERGVMSLKVVYSYETPLINSSPVGSVSFVPGAAGLVLASEVVRDMLA